MDHLFFFLFLTSIIALIIGLIKPQRLRLPSRKKVGIIFGILSLVFFMLIGVYAEPVDNLPTPLNNEMALTEELLQPEVEENISIKENDPVITNSATSETTPTQNPIHTPTSYKVSSVVDGDTIKVTINEQTETIRIIGLNTPETVDPRKPVECFGKEASAKAKELLLGKTVYLEIDNSQGDRDRYNRLLRYVTLPDGNDFGLIMISSGYAYEYTYNTPYEKQAQYKNAEELAKTGGKGFWSSNTCNGSTSTTTSDNTSTTISSGKYYTSSASNAKRYYPESCSAWQQLSPSNLRTFNSLEELLNAFPGRTLAEACK